MPSEKPLSLSIMFFSTDAEGTPVDRYQLVMRACRLADRLGFKAAWFPERHFHRFGGLFPNPAVVAAALAPQTTRLRLRAGSVVLPIHDPIRVAEEWAVVDNISHGRVDLAFATGWDADSFVLAPEQYAQRLDATFNSARIVQQLWEGQEVPRINGNQQACRIRVHPRPVQPRLPIWITATHRPALFRRAGECGYNLLTALLFQNLAELAERTREYRKARASAGHIPHRGKVTLMLHSFATRDWPRTHSFVRARMLEYLAASVDLWSKESERLAAQTPESRTEMLQIACERYLRFSSLIGDVSHCQDVLQKVKAIDVDEVACLIDFGLPIEEIEESLRCLATLNAEEET